MRFIRSAIFLISGGFVLSLGWLIAALLCAPLRVTRPLAASCLQLAGLCLWPFAKEVVRDAQIVYYRNYLRTGELKEDGAPSLWSARLALQALLWLPMGIVLVGAHALHAVLMAAPTLANPWDPANRGLLRAAVLPLGITVAAVDQAEAVRFSGSSRRSLPYASLLRIGSRVGIALRRMAKPLARASGAGLILWATSSANEAHLHSPTAAFDAPQQFGLQRPRSTSNDRVAPGGYRVRPEASPPLPVERAVATSAPLKKNKEDCSAPIVRRTVTQLSRRHSEFGALPLGSRQIGAKGPVERTYANDRILKVQEWALPVRQAKVVGTLCIEAARYRITRATSFAARIALAERLARKAEPEASPVAAGGRLTHIGPSEGHLVALRHLAGMKHWTGVAMHAKADDVPPAELMASRIANTASLASKGVSARLDTTRAVRAALLERSGEKLAQPAYGGGVHAALTAPAS